MINKEYYLGLDCGTDSVGYAVTDAEYNLLKFKGEPIIGVTTFEGASLADERRGHRTGRRRLDRRQHRVQLLQELFAESIAAVDSKFFIRIRESALLREDKSDPRAKNVYFNDSAFTEKDYYKAYPTIHHLICELMESPKPHDVRLVYIACVWLVAHRGHFLSPISEENAQDVMDITSAYADFMNLFEGEKPWECEVNNFAQILKAKIGISIKEKQFKELLFGGKKPKDLIFDTEDSASPVLSREQMVKLLCGGKVELKKLFLHKADEYAEMGSLTLGGKEEDLEAILAQLGDDAELIEKLKSLYDWAVLTDVLNGEKYISKAKVKTYEQHGKDLKFLKKFIKKYIPDKYDIVFNHSQKGNYSEYVNHPSGKETAVLNHVSKGDFCDFIKKLVKDIKVASSDKKQYEDMLCRLETYSFMPKQKDTDNRVIPHQLYGAELNRILENAEQYLPFLKEKDIDNLTVSDKIKSIFKFRIPYYVGPLNPKSSHAWLERKSGKIYPWNFEKMVDLDKSEENFIRNLIGRCTYLPGEYVMPKNSLYYTRFMVLNEINPIKINDIPISPEQKQAIYHELFERRKRVTYKALKDFCISEGYMDKDGVITGIDAEGVKSSLLPWNAFHRLIRDSVLTVDETETIIEHLACTEERARLIRWLKKTYPSISEEDVNYISKLKLKDFGRFSYRFLCELEGMEKSTGQIFTILQAMWETNYTLMELLSDKFTFMDAVKEETKAYYAANPHTMVQRMDDLYLSNTVRRQIYRALDVVKDVVKAAGAPPKKIFIEMARGADENGKGKRTKTRRQQILEHYKKISDSDVRELSNLLESKDDNALQSDKLYLYFMQLGKCMYSGQPISLEELNDEKRYDIDHIFPQCRVKDDSILNNKVLCLSEYNGSKGDKYPINPLIRANMAGFWVSLHKNGLITDEKYRRLIRTTPFTADEQMGFIQRQLVETRQSTKALASILSERYPKSKIVYVKAGLVSDFRQEYALLKSRTVNDLHHAKDAYLNIVVGNVYYERFNKNFFRLDQNYSVKTKAIFDHPVYSNGKLIWNGKTDEERIKGIVGKNHVHVTRFAFCRKGQLFDLQPLPAGSGAELLPRKANLPAEKYGGYRKPAASFFVLAKYFDGKKSELMIVPIDLLEDAAFEKDAVAVTQNAIKKVTGKSATSVSLPFGNRKIKINTVLSLDGFRVALSGKASGGKQLLISPLVALMVDLETERYIKRIESFCNKKKVNASIKADEQHDKITAEENVKLYDLLANKLSAAPFNKRPAVANVSDALIKGRKKFLELDLEKQILQLAEVLVTFSRSGAGSDLTLVGGVGKAGVPTLSSTVSNWKKNYSDVRIIDQSPAGLWGKVSENLLTLL